MASTANNYNFKIPTTEYEARKIINFFYKILFQLVFKRN